MPRRVLLPVLLILASAAHAATITVTTTADTIAADGGCSLREAMTAANTNAAVNECTAGTAGLDTIAFHIGVGGLQTIAVTSQLPVIEESMTIDGSTQPGFSSTPLITVRATAAVNAGFQANEVGNNTFRSLAIGGFGIGIFLRSAFNRITNCHIGIDAAGNTAIPNGEGVLLHSITAPPFFVHDNVVDGNVVSGNAQLGVGVGTAEFGSAYDNQITGNTIGLNRAKTAAVPNGQGIQILAGAFAPGDTNGEILNTIIRDNVVAGNNNNGIWLRVVSSATVQNNQLGLPGLGNGEAGIRISGQNVTVEANTITGNGGPGVYGRELGPNRVLSNSIDGNGGLAIDLHPIGPDPNDHCDLVVFDHQANKGQNYPVLTRAVTTGSQLSLSGTLDSLASTPFTLEFYWSPAPGQAKTLLGSANVTTAANCTASFAATFSASVPPGGFITATATGPNGTSEISAAFAAVASSDIPALSPELLLALALLLGIVAWLRLRG